MRSPAWRHVVRALLVTAGLGCPMASNAADDQPPRPNFVMILADDMGYGDLSAYGGWVDAPRLKRMAEQGLRFTDFHSSGTVCSPTRAGLLTGRYQQRAGIPGVVNADPRHADYHRALQPAEHTFAELLRAAGYRVGMFGKWHLGYDARHNPIHHGFDEFRGFVIGNIDYVSHLDRMGTPDWWHGDARVEEAGYLTHLLTRHAVAFIERHHDRPFCLYVPHGAVHSPIQSPTSLATRGPSAAADPNPGQTQDDVVRDMTLALDESVGAVLDALVARGIHQRTLVWFFSDNGGAAHMRCDPLRGRKGQVWEGGHRVPAIAWWPEHIAPGQVTDQLCISLDVMPTLLELAGVEPPADRPLDGVSLAPLLTRSESLGPRQLFWRGEAMRDGPWKLVVSAPGLSDGPALFDLRGDIAERHNLAKDHPERTSDMLQALAAWREDVATGATPQPEHERFMRQHGRRAKRGPAR